MRVLIADDHDLLRDTLVMFLEGKGLWRLPALVRSKKPVL